MAVAMISLESVHTHTRTEPNRGDMYIQYKAIWWPPFSNWLVSRARIFYTKCKGKIFSAEKRNGKMAPPMSMCAGKKKLALLLLLFGLSVLGE